MKNLPFTVEIKLSDSVYDDTEIIEMTNNIAKAIEYHIQHSEKGIAPENSEAFVEKVSVVSRDVGHCIEIKLI